MPVQHGSNPYVYGDALGPVFGQALGAAAPSDGILATADPADVTMDVHCLAFNENTEDRQYCSIQVDHDLLIPGSGNIIFRPHIHWTFYNVEPADGQTVIWRLAYVYAKPGVTAANAGAFAAAPSILTAATYTTSGATELRKHLISSFGDITVAASDCGPSMIFMYTFKLDTSSTIAASRVSALYVDWHYRKGPIGTIGEFA